MAAIGLVWLCCFTALAAADDAPATVASVNGVSITQGDVDFALSQQGVAPDQRGKETPKVIERLIDRQLIREFLASQKIEPPEEEVQFQISKAEAYIRKGGEDPAVVLAKLGYSSSRLKAELGLPLAWQVYVRKTVTAEQVKDYFEQHKQELDGTQLRANQIVLKLPMPAEADVVEAKKKVLAEVRNDLMAKKLTFAEAAMKYSESPTRARGGDVGLFGWQGKLPAAVSHAAFALKIGEISEPIVSPVGVHLIQVTERQVGDFSLEDVRPVIMERLSQQMWTQTVQQARTGARIERRATP
ncbi:peptidylprolyl isomerase [Schlesneria sp. DSM 10557]|uniref:peptidylprolyl isomerase n=1 Tax=Schlesneria sp. DSM 10557 TaxID=3044399 RepID=UPI00359F638D